MLITITGPNGIVFDTNVNPIQNSAFNTDGSTSPFQIPVNGTYTIKIDYVGNAFGATPMSLDRLATHARGRARTPRARPLAFASPNRVITNGGSGSIVRDERADSPARWRVGRTRPQSVSPRALKEHRRFLVWFDISAR